MSEIVSAQTLTEMVSYYRARAHEYDEWFYRRGRYDRGSEINADGLLRLRKFSLPLMRWA